MSKYATHKAQSVLTIVIVMMAMLLQFHNHDCHGNIFWHLTPHAELTIGVYGCCVDECHPGNKECGHQSHNHHGHYDCSMHIAVAVMSPGCVGAESHWYMESVPNSVPGLISRSDELTHTFRRWKDCSCYKAPLLASFRFRGPPAFVA